MSESKFENVKKALKEDSKEHRPRISGYSEESLTSFIKTLENYAIDENEMNEFQLAVIDRRITRGVSPNEAKEMLTMVKIKLVLLECRQALKEVD